MKRLSLLVLVLGLFFLGIGGNFADARDISGAELAKMTTFINNFSRGAWPDGHDSIDLKSKQWSDKDAVVFCLYYLYNMGSPRVKHIENGTPVDIYMNGEKVREYNAIKIADLKATVREIFGMNIGLADDFTGSYAGYTVLKNGLILGDSDAGMSPEYKISKAARNNDGTIRISAIASSPDEPDDKTKYNIVLKENQPPVDGVWQVLYFKQAK